MRGAVRPYVEKEENREAFRRDGARDWNAYQVTDLHVTELEDGYDVALPECHV